MTYKIIEYNTSYYFTKFDNDISELINYIIKRFKINEHVELKIKYQIAHKRYVLSYVIFEFYNKEGKLLVMVNPLLKITTALSDNDKQPPYVQQGKSQEIIKYISLLIKNHVDKCRLRKLKTLNS